MTADKLMAIKSKTAEFINSVGFIWVLALITFIFWVTKLTLPGIAVICAVMGIILALCEDATPIISCFAFLFLIFGETEMHLTGTELLWSLFLLFPLAGFIFHAVRYKIKPFKLGGFSLSVIITLFAWLLQGVGMERETFGAAVCILIAIAFAAVYFVIYAVTKREGSKLPDYLANVFLAVGALISLQIAVYHFSEGDFLFKDDWTLLGWGHRNAVAAIMALVLPAPFYFAAKIKKFGFLFIIAGSVEYILILLLQSRGVSALSSVEFLIMLVYSVAAAKKKDRIKNAIVVAVIAVAAIAVFIWKREVIIGLFNRLLTSKLDVNGRDKLWTEGIERFFDKPVFGVGFDCPSELYREMVSKKDGPVFYHSTFIQILASLGLFGGICYAYTYYWRYREIFTDMNKLKFAFLIGMAAFEAYCFIDTVYFQPVGYFYMLMISLCVEKSLDESQIKPNLIIFTDWAKIRVPRK